MIIIQLLSIYTLSFFIRNLSGPFNLFGIIRNKLLSNKWFGVFFYELLNCPFCIGFHCGYAIYILQYTNFNIKHFMLWALAGSTIVAIIDAIIQKLHE